MKNREVICFLVLISFLTLLPSVGSAALLPLLNPGFESGTTSWIEWGEGTYSSRDTRADAHSGKRSLWVNSGGSYAMRYQRVNAVAGSMYTVGAWVKQSSGNNSASIKVGFLNGGEQIVSYSLSVAATDTWTYHSISHVSPVGTTLVSAVCVANNGSSILFDDVSIEEGEAAPPEPISYDLTNSDHDFLGFGAQIWGHGSDASYPNLEAIRQQALSELNIKYVRIDDTAALAPMQRTKAMTDALGIKWISMTWAAPAAYTSGGMLSDVPGFATWWTNHVLYYVSNGIPIEYIELMNEPDSAGGWSTGIAYADYNDLVKDLRPKLDAAGLQDTGIVGPGATFLSSYPGYSNAFDATGINSIAAWSTHLWDAVNNSGPSIENSVETQFLNYALSDNENYLRIVTEYATKIQNVDGYWYPHANKYHIDQDGNATLHYDEARIFPYYSQSNSMPFAAKVYENTLSILNGGANVPMVWQAIDEPTEVFINYKGWGLLDLWGDPKPVYGALKTLYPEIPVGANVLVPPDQTANNLYTAAFTKGKSLVVAIANSTSTSQTDTIYLTNGPDDLKVIKATAFERTYFGDPANSDPDIGQEFAKSLTLVEPSPGDYSFDVTLAAHSTLTVILTVKPDFDVDGKVDLKDFAKMSAAWQGPSAEADIAPDGGDGIVDLQDLVLLITHWCEGATP